MKLTVSVIIPTFDRLKLLEKALLSLIKQNFNKKSYEIIVADNCSYHWADLVVNKIKRGRKFPKIIHLKINKQGVNKARNEGLKTARGRIIAFCDDDVLVDRLWLKNIVRAHRDYPSVLAIGGKVEPIWERKKPSWLPQRMEGYLAILDFGKLPLKNPPWLVGANLSFKKKAFKMFGNFDESLGRRKRSFMFKDEIEFLERIKRGQGEILYLPDIKVKHLISKKRATLGFLLRRVFWEGRSEARVDKIMRKNLLKNGFDWTKEASFTLIRGSLGLVKGDKKTATEALISPVFAFGYLYQAVLEKK